MNPSFEEYWSCPTSNDLNDGQLEKCKYWWKPSMGTSDYFNRCNNGVVSVPNNFWGYQEAYHGDGYVGIGTIEFDVNGNHVGNEYIRTELLSPLKPCVEYRFKMYVSLANLSTHAIGNLGALFSQENEFYNTWLSIDAVPQIIYHGTPIIDTTNWTLIEGTFVASGFEKFITIGYFNDNVFEDTTFIQDFGFGSYSYYYLDSISLNELGSVPSEICSVQEVSLPNVLTPNNDGVNDFINAFKYFDFIEEITIMNRWGISVVTLNKENPIWDGGNCEDGIYFYTFSYLLLDKQKQQTGFIHLVR